jgi:hypothetical protein
VRRNGRPGFLRNEGLAPARIKQGIRSLFMKKFSSFLALAVIFILKGFSQDVSEFEYLPVDLEGYEFGKKTTDVSQIAGVVITKYKGTKKDIIIPDKINGLPVIGFYPFAFFNCGLDHVTFPETIDSIGGFMNNNLTSIVIPKSVKFIEPEAFANNPLTSITFLGETELYRNVPYVPSISEEFDNYFNNFWYLFDFKGLPAKYIYRNNEWVLEEFFDQEAGF